jgi:hypothetical protein
MDTHTAFMIGIAALFCTIALNRFLGERNYKRLAPEDKVKLVNEFSAHRSRGTYIPLAVMGLVIVFDLLSPGTSRWLFPVGVAAVLFTSVVLQVTILRHLDTLELPADFVSRYRFQSIAVQVGNLVALSLFAYAIMSSR